jgi:hypothetical protein
MVAREVGYARTFFLAIMLFPVPDHGCRCDRSEQKNDECHDQRAG